MASAKVLEGKEHYLANFEKFDREPPRNGSLWIDSLRKEAIAKFAELGFPTTRRESWLHTNVAPLGKIAFQPVEPNEAELSASETVDEALREFSFGEDLNSVVFINGRFSPVHSRLHGTADNFKVISLSEAIRSNGEEVKAHLAKHASFAEDPFVALNTAFVQDGAYISIASGAVVERPIHILYLTLGGEPIYINPRNLIVAGELSQASIVECYASLSHDVYFTNAVTEIAAGDNSMIRHYRLQQESDAAYHINTVQVELGRSANFLSELITVGGILTRNNVNALLGGEGIECTLNGLYMGTGRQHIDNHTRLDHAKPNCVSHELYKGILDENATGVFTGRIHVWPDAQKTDSKQSNKSLLLSDTATAFTEPQLEIYADDVKCTHGATVGQLDEDQIFYLRARGIDHETARGLLTFAFANGIIEQIAIPAVRKKLEHLVFERFKRGKMTE